mmetsp:Transcript_1292/g.2079  ORF Transcript_1292/g.2079 Transcript_1292/m.2079 type:complete len:118 (-) Transcript_1292:636-989(-)
MCTANHRSTCNITMQPTNNYANYFLHVHICLFPTKQGQCFLRMTINYLHTDCYCMPAHCSKSLFGDGTGSQMNRGTALVSGHYTLALSVVIKTPILSLNVMHPRIDCNRMHLLIRLL